MGSTHQQLVQDSKEYTLFGWTSQDVWDPLSMVKARGVYFWDADGKRYLDWSSQLVNVNVGHSHPGVIEAIREQAGTLSCAYPGIATEPRARLGAQLREIAPVPSAKTFFTLGGADAIENAMKFARLYTGRPKILARFRAYHGATFGAMTAGGDPRRLPNEPGVPWVVHIHDPYAYRSPIYRGRTADEGDVALGDLVEETVLLEGPERIAAILLEGYSGTSGIIQGGTMYWDRIAEICREYGILLIIDEVMSGFGRTGKWFGVQHYPSVNPDIVTIAKGLTSGYVPLGAVLVKEEIAHHFDANTLWSGLTYGAHPLGCAAGIANINVYRDENLIENARIMGELLGEGLRGLADRYKCIGDVRGTGLLWVLELVRSRRTREPLSGFNQAPSTPMKEISAELRRRGLSTIVRWNMIFCAPPLVVTADQIEEGISILGEALQRGETHCEAQ
jgi:taurine--2-oxoglutarate transaminase